MAAPVSTAMPCDENSAPQNLNIEVEKPWKAVITKLRAVTPQMVSKEQRGQKRSEPREEDAEGGPSKRARLSSWLDATSRGLGQATVTVAAKGGALTSTFLAKSHEVGQKAVSMGTHGGAVACKYFIDAAHGTQIAAGVLANHLKAGGQMGLATANSVTGRLATLKKLHSHQKQDFNEHEACQENARENELKQEVDEKDKQETTQDKELEPTEQIEETMGEDQGESQQGTIQELAEKHAGEKDIAEEPKHEEELQPAGTDKQMEECVEEKIEGEAENEGAFIDEQVREEAEIEDSKQHLCGEDPYL